MRLLERFNPQAAPEPEPWLYDYTVTPYMNHQVLVTAWFWPRGDSKPQRPQWALPYTIADLNADPDKITRQMEYMARSYARQTEDNKPDALNRWLISQGKPPV